MKSRLRIRDRLYSVVEKHGIQKLIAALFAVFLLWTIVEQPYRNGPPIRSDGKGYHIWVGAFRSLDFNFCRFKADLTYSISVENTANGRCGVKYPPGVALFQAPFTIYSPVPAKSNRLFSDYSHYMILLIGSGLLLASLWLVNSSLDYFNVSTAHRVIAMIGGLFGTGLFHYATYDASFSHIYSTFGVSAILYLAIKLRQDPESFSQKHLLWWAILCLWLYLVRQTNLFPIVFICLFAIVPNPIARKQIAFSASGAMATIFALLILIGYNYYVTGEFLISSYGAEGFHPFGKFSYEVLFSYRRGLFLYYPFALIALTLAIFAKQRALALCFFALIASYVLLYGTWHSWWLGAGMGHRGFVEAMPIAMVLVATGLTQFRKSPIRWAAYTAIIFSSFVTLRVMTAYWAGDFPFGGADKALYMKTVLGSSEG